MAAIDGAGGPAGPFAPYLALQWRSNGLHHRINVFSI